MTAKLVNVRIGDHLVIVDGSGCEARGRVVRVSPDHCGLVCNDGLRRLKATEANTLRIERREDRATFDQARGALPPNSIGAPAVMISRTHQRTSRFTPSEK